MPGYIGDDYNREIAELSRVTKPNGYKIDCMGEDDRKRTELDKEMLKAGFNYLYYKSKTGSDAYWYIKQAIK